MKIGIIGSENSHATAFSEILAGMGIETVVDDNLSPSADLDGLMVVARDGKFHKEIALPFIEAGIPTWIDKPITVDPSQAEELLSVAKRLNVPVTGGSTCKFAPFFIALRDKITDDSLGEVRSAMMNLPASPQSEYSGIHFYAHHLCELMLLIFGYEVRSLRAIRHNDNILCHVYYDTVDVVLNFQEDVQTCCISLLGTKDCFVTASGLGDGYQPGVEAFVEMIRTGKPPIEYDKLIYPIHLVHAIEQSYLTDKEIILQK